jgi:hypothetical protein
MEHNMLPRYEFGNFEGRIGFCSCRIIESIDQPSSWIADPVIEPN